jgi:hypothetical protein
MAHWRDGGIGNMPGSDDRPIEEWTLLERLNNPERLYVDHDGQSLVLDSTAVEAIMYDAAAEIERLRRQIAAAAAALAAPSRP